MAVSKTNKKNVLTGIIGLIVLGVTIVTVYLTQKWVPVMMDDLWYSTKLSDDTPIRNARDIFEAQVWHYNNWGGRSMAHTLLQFILLTGAKCADVLNTCAIVFTGMIVIKFAGLSGKKETCIGEYLIKLSIIIGCIHGLNANWEMSMYWQSGAANYLYITMFIMAFIYVYVREIMASFNGEASLSKKIPGIDIWIVPLAIIVGWSNENMGPTSFLIAVFAIAVNIYKHQKVKIWMILGAVLCAAGCAVCILAPGNFVRSGQVVSNNYGIVWQIYLRFYGMFKGYLEYLFPVIMLTAAVAVFVIFELKQSLKIQEIVLLAAGIVSCGAMLLSPHFPDRASYGSMMCFILADALMLRRAAKADSKYMIGVYIVGGVIWLRAMYILSEFLGISWGWIL